jgi:hypothetical protein
MAQPDIAVLAPGLIKFLKATARAVPQFDKGIREASNDVAVHVANRVKAGAAAQPAHGRVRSGGSGRSQAAVVADAIKARRDRIPKIGFTKGNVFVSKSRPNSKRKQRVLAGDVFFGAEFGGGRRKTTQQFLRHRGRQGYFFWQAVRDSRSFIAEQYLTNVEKVIKKISPGAD